MIILGKSDATITMILDNLESNGNFPAITIVNNLKSTIEKNFDNCHFNIHILERIPEVKKDSQFMLGAFQAITKRKIFEHFGIEMDQFVSIIHAQSSISSTSILGNGCLINSFVSVAAHTKIGNFVSLNRNASIGHHTIISDFVSINPGANIAGNVQIGENTQIGMGANVIDGVKIGKNCVVGAGSLITKDVPDHVMVYGVPAKIIKHI